MIKEDIVWYHGSPNLFKVFDYKYIRTNGSSEGVGFYFTNSLKVANCYAKEGYIMQVTINKGKRLMHDKVMFTIATLSKFLKYLDKTTDCDFLSNYGEVKYSGFNVVLKEAVDSLIVCDSDVDIICSIVNSVGSCEKVLRALNTCLGINYIEQDADWGKESVKDAKHRILIALVPEIIQIKSFAKVQTTRTKSAVEKSKVTKDTNVKMISANDIIGKNYWILKEKCLAEGVNLTKERIGKLWGNIAYLVVYNNTNRVYLFLVFNLVDGKSNLIKEGTQTLPNLINLAKVVESTNNWLKQNNIK